ncbi:coiled-coil domain-containing protein 17 [Seriola lalandi dorsalis]|uniref:coiled-coil domain-containing protein 17 n=1 Tax=Seriola lalandi dorsalis TaxID=1841481 RepID=UPI000C6F5325|nr:coiled-coil domain-containing protein 17 [Seriola lalandi dorsalis]
MEEELICGACNMVFRSNELLGKHTALFCIGSEVNGGGVDPKQTRTPDLSQMRGQRRNVIRRRSVDAEPKAGKAEDKAASSQTDRAAVQNLTDEFHKLRMSIEEHLPNQSKRKTHTEASGCHLGHSERLREMREMATLHERQLALIHAHNQQLEQQRDELAQQVSVLSEQSNATHLESLLMELREQEERNEETLQQLAEHLHMIYCVFAFLLLFSVQKVPVPADQPDPGKNKKMHHENYELISSVAGPLSTQIKALQQAYVQSGGSDPVIVAQMIDLQSQAQSLEKNQSAASTKARKKTTSLSSSFPELKPCQWCPSLELLVLEQENQRLEEEILRIQLARERNHDYEAAAARTELGLIQRENLQQLSSLQAEMERGKEAPWPWRQPPPPPPPPRPLPLQTKTHIHAPLSLVRSCSSLSGRGKMDPLDSLDPAPYNPAAGFVVFFDLVLGLDASLKALRLVAAVYSEGLQVGPPTPLPPVQCLRGVSLPYSHGLTPGNCALLSVKQPAPRIQPSPSLCLVVEVQAASNLDVYNQEVFKMASCGWTQLELFDQYNQLRSGHWRVPVRRLPIKPSLSIAQLNSVPQVGNMELCVRLVNGRDGDVQTLAKPDPTSTGHYKYPAVVSPLPATVHRNASLPVSAPPPTGADELSSLLTSTDHRDPPPTDEASHS